MRLVFPNSHRINRGNYVVKELAEACRANDVTDLVVLHEHRGVPGACTYLNMAGRWQTSRILNRRNDCLALPPWTYRILHTA